jgi:hypothetical protein
MSAFQQRRHLERVEDEGGTVRQTVLPFVAPQCEFDGGLRDRQISAEAQARVRLVGEIGRGHCEAQSD